MIKSKSSIIAFLVLLTFTWLCFFSEFSFSQSYEDDILIKAKKLTYEGNYDEAIFILKDYIIKYNLQDDNKQNLAIAYFLLGRTYYFVGEDKLANENLRVVFKINPDFKVDENDFLFNELVKKIMTEVITNIDTSEKKKEVAKKEEKTKTDENEKGIFIPVQKKTDEDVKTEGDKKQENLETITQKKPDIEKNMLENKSDKKIIAKPIKNKPKKKFPWLLVAGGAVLVGAIMFILLKNKSKEEETVVANITGTWEGHHYSTTTSTYTEVRYVLTQSGTSISGEYYNLYNGTSASCNGTIFGNDVTLKITKSGYWLEATGKLSGNTMSGTFDSSSGQVGTWEITKVSN